MFNFMRYYFLQEDLDDLDSRITELKERIKKAAKDKHLATTQTSETWHDNYGFEEGVRQINFLTNNIEKLLEIKNKAAIINPAKNNQANIGSTVIFKDETGKESEIKIGSYLIVSQKKNYVSYESPLGKILLGAKAGERKKGIVGNKEKEFYIIKID